jgi:glutathione S-transferase
VTSGDLAAALSFDILLSLQPDCLDAYPALKQFAQTVLALPCFDTYKTFEMYFARK